jgi:hypothetical protein
MPVIKNIQGLPKILGQISGVNSSREGMNKNIYFGKEILGSTPTFAQLNPSGFLSVGRLRALVYSVAIENE